MKGPEELECLVAVLRMWNLELLRVSPRDLLLEVIASLRVLPQWLQLGVIASLQVLPQDLPLEVTTWVQVVQELQLSK